MNCLVGSFAGCNSIDLEAGLINASGLEGLSIGFIVEVKDIWGGLNYGSAIPFALLESVLLLLVLGALYASAQFNL